MLNRLRKRLERDTPGGGAPQLTSNNESNSEQSGFICPMCMANLKSAEDLQSHFDMVHSTPDPPDSKTTQEQNFGDEITKNGKAEASVEDLEHKHDKMPAFSDKNFAKESLVPTSDIAPAMDREPPNNQVDIALLQGELGDLKSSLNEEQWYSAELKKEMENLREEKNKISEDYDVLQKQLTIAIATNEELAKQKENLERKAVSMAQTMADIKSAQDELESQKDAVEERCKNQSVELEKAATWVRDLESQLLQRPGADDVMVLKKELVSVQTLMDQMTLESEEKGKEVESERQHLQQLLDQAQNQAQLVQMEFDEYKAENARLKSENEETAAASNQSLKQFEEEREKLNKLFSEKENTIQEELKNLQFSLEKEQSYSQSLEAENNRLQEDKVSMKEDISRLSVDLNNLVELSKKDKERYEELSSKHEEIESAKTESESQLALVKEQLESFRKDNELSSTEKEARLESLLAERNEIKSQLNELERAYEESINKNEKLNHEFEELRESTKQIEIDSSSFRQKLEIEIAQMKIRMETLQDDNKSLLEQKSSLESNLEATRKEHEEERNSAQSKLLEAEQEILSFKLKNSQLENEKLQKSENLGEIQVKLSTIQAAHDESQEKLHSINTEFALKQQEIESLKEKLTKSSMKLEEEASRTEKASEEAAKLREERTYLMAQMEAGEGEAAARAQIAEENNLLRRQKEETEEKLRLETSQHEVFASELNMKLSQTNTLLASTQQQLHASEQAVVRLREEFGYEREKLVQTESELKTKAELLASTEAASLTQRADIENHLATVKRSLDDKVKELQKSNEDLNNSRSTVDELKTQISQLRQDHHVEVANIRNDLERSRNDTADALNTIEKVKEEMKRLEETNAKEMERKIEEKKVMEAQHIEKTTSLQSAMTELRCELSRMTDDHQREVSQRTRVEVELNQTKRQLKESDDNGNKTQMKLDETLTALQKFHDDLSEAQSKQEKLCKELKEEKNKSNEEQEALKEEIRKLREESEAQIVLLQENIENKEKLLEDETKASVAVKLLLSDSELQVTALKDDLEKHDETLNDLQTQKSAAEESLTAQISEQLKTIENLTEELNSSNKHREEVCSRLEESTSVKSSTEQELNKIRYELDERTTLLTETEVELENSKTQLHSLRSEAEGLKITVSTLESDKQSLEKSSSEKATTVKELEDKLESLKSELTDIGNALETSKEQLRLSEEEALARKLEFEEKCEQQESELQTWKERGEKLQMELDEEKRRREYSTEKGIEESKKFEEKQLVWEAERKEFTQKIESLEAAQNLLISHKVEFQKSVESLQIALDREKKNAIAAEEAARKDSEAKDLIVKKVKEQLEIKGRELESAEAERVVSESRLQLEIGTLSENLNTTRSEWVTTTQRVDAMGRENDDLRGQLMVLNATIQSNADERRALLERCLHAEQQVEQQNGKVNELRGKLEAAHSAMHELGRENQALQVKHTTTISRQWTDDSATKQCKACGRAFSFAVRKHHCRHCGDIFCNECSSRSATVAASKNPVRVCERCYDDLLVAS